MCKNVYPAIDTMLSVAYNANGDTMSEKTSEDSIMKKNIIPF